MRTPFREAGSLINQTATVLRHNAAQASPHRHHRTSVASAHDDRTRYSQSGPATESTNGSRVCELRPRVLFPDLSETICDGKNAVAPDPCVPRVSPPHTTEIAAADYLFSSARPAADDLRWSIPSG